MSERSYRDSHTVALDSAEDAWPVLQACERVLLRRFGAEADYDGVEVTDTAGSFSRPTVGEARDAATEHPVTAVRGHAYRRAETEGRWDPRTADAGTFEGRHLDNEPGDYMGPEVTVRVSSTDPIETNGLVETMRRTIERELELIRAQRQPEEPEAVAEEPAPAPQPAPSLLHNPWVVTVVGGVVATVLAALILALLLN